MIERLKTDAFHAAFGIYIRDLKENQTKLDEWRERVEGFFNDDCRPVVQRAVHHESMRREHDQRCAGQQPVVWARNGCQQTFDWLLRSKAQLDQELKAIHAKQQDFNQQGAALLSREVQAVQRARGVLDPRNSEDAFRLYTSLREREVRAKVRTSCDVMAELFQALAQRLDYDGPLFLSVLERTLAVAQNPVLAAKSRFPVLDETIRGRFNFSGTGFRREFYRGATRDHIRHFTFYFVQGIRMGLTVPAAASFYEDYLKDQPEDFRLTLAALKLADLYGRSPHGIGEAIKREICD